jgi:alpha-tubulin suppressor-like RCC1 family protein
MVNRFMKLLSSLYRYMAIALLVSVNLTACGKNSSTTVTSSTAPSVIYSHSLSIQGGTVVSWGYNGYGQLGLRDNNNIDSRYQPNNVTGLPVIQGVSAGGTHSLAFINLSTVRAWGNNGNGQLGDTTTTANSYPVRVLVNAAGNPALSRVIDVAAGNNHSLALDESHTVWSWGGNYDGQLGDGTLTSRSVADKVKDAAGNPLTGATMIAAGGEHSLALISGAVFAWGLNDNGQLGHNDTANHSTPVQVYKDDGTTPLDNIIAIAAGGGHSLALEQNGTIYTIWAWGLNSRGQLGDGTPVRRLHAVPVVWPGLAGHSVLQLAAGLSHSLALLDDGTVWGWGDDFFGQLGDGAALKSETAVTSPHQVVNTGTLTPLSGITAIAAIGTHSLAFGGVAGTSVWAWGDNVFGELGDNTTNGRSTASPVTGLPLP